MRTLIIATIAAASSFTALVQPASACARGYHTVWIKGYPICAIKTPNLPLKAKQ